MPSISDPARPALTYEELWAAWAPLTAEEENRETKPLDEGIASLSLDESGYRAAYAPCPAADLLRMRQLRRTRLEIYRDIVDFYARDNKGERFDRLWEELNAPGMRQFGLALRCKRAEEGKEAASKKYKDGDWFGALYTYAIAWGCMVPYFPEALEDTDPLKKEMNRLEMALFSNISAMALSAASGKSTAQTLIVPHDMTPGILHLGLRASVYVMARTDIVSVGIMQKSCRRAGDLADKLSATFNITAGPPAQVAYWKKQEEALKGVKPDMLFCNAPKGKQLPVSDADVVDRGAEKADEGEPPSTAGRTGI